MENTELLDALNLLEAERNISKEVLLEAIQNALLIASKNHFGKADNNLQLPCDRQEDGR